MAGFKHAFVCLLGRCFSSLSYPDLVENVSVSQTLEAVMLVNFQDFGIFDHKQYFQGPKSKLLENIRPTPAFFSGTSGYSVA